MTRVVVDANVYISALAFGGAPQKALDLIQQGGLSLYLSLSIIDEVSGTLVRKFGWARSEIEQFLPPLWDRCIVLTPTERLKISPDPDDNHVLECAATARAGYLVTGNTKHFPKQYLTTKVVTVRQLLNLLMAG